MKTIQLTLKVKTLKTKQEAEDFGAGAAEHLMETFNDDDSIAACYYKTIPNRPRAILAVVPDLLEHLKEAVSSLNYHAPDRFDDAEHERNWHAMIARHQAVIDKAEGRPS